MSKETSVAPKERINITYVPATGDQQAELELPLKLMVVGDYTGRPDERPVEERELLDIDKDNFNDILAGQAPTASFSVADKLSGEEDAELAIDLEFSALNDFSPESVARSVPELSKLLELREALVALKGPLGNVPAFRKKIRDILESEEAREKLLTELKVDEEQTDGE